MRGTTGVRPWLPALAAGNGVIWKPHPDAALTAMVRGVVQAELVEPVLKAQLGFSDCNYNVINRFQAALLST